MFCHNCGKEVPAGSHYCGNCGAKIEEPVSGHSIAGAAAGAVSNLSGKEELLKIEPIKDIPIPEQRPGMPLPPRTMEPAEEEELLKIEPVKEIEIPEQRPPMPLPVIEDVPSRTGEERYDLGDDDDVLPAGFVDGGLKKAEEPRTAEEEILLALNELEEPKEEEPEIRLEQAEVPEQPEELKAEEEVELILSPIMEEKPLEKEADVQLEQVKVPEQPEELKAEKEVELTLSPIMEEKPLEKEADVQLEQPELPEVPEELKPAEEVELTLDPALEEEDEPLLESTEEPAEPEEEEYEEEAQPEVTDQPLEEEKKSYKKLMIWIIAVLLIAALIIGLFFILHKPAASLKKYMETARTSLEAGDYEGAIAACNEASSKRGADNQEILAMENEIYDAWIADLKAAGDYEKALDVTKSALENDPERKTELLNTAASVYTEVLNAEFEKGDKEGLTKSLNDARDRFGGDVYNVLRPAHDRLLTDLVKADLSNMASGGFGALVAANDFDGIFQYLDSHDYLNIVTKLPEGASYPVRFVSGDETEGNQFGLYGADGSYAIYYGPYNNGQREGNGSWIYYDQGSGYTKYVVRSAWAKDKPEGAFEERYELQSSSGNLRQRTAAGSFTSGLYSGEIKVAIDGLEYYFSFERGILQILDKEDPNGDVKNVVAYTADKRHWRSFANEKASLYTDKYGAPLYGHLVY